MEFFRTDANDGPLGNSQRTRNTSRSFAEVVGACGRGPPTVLIMHLLNLPAQAISQDYIVVKLIPPRCGREFGTWEFGDGGKVEAVNEATEDVEGRQEGDGGEESGIHVRVQSRRRTSDRYGEEWDWDSRS